MSARAIARLESMRDACIKAENAARNDRAGIESKIDELRLEQRPSLPTDEHRSDMGWVAQRIRDSVVPSSHLGEPAPLRSISVNGARGWMHFKHGAPYTRRGTGSRLWTFTADETAEILELIISHGLTIEKHWLSDGGLSVQVYPPSGGGS